MIWRYPYFSPQAIFKDPFRKGNNILVKFIYWHVIHSLFSVIHAFSLFVKCKCKCKYWKVNKGIIVLLNKIYYFNFFLYFTLQVMCDAYTPAGEPIPTNKRHNAAKIFSHPDVVAEEPWFVHFVILFYFSFLVYLSFFFYFFSFLVL